MSFSLRGLLSPFDFFVPHKSEEIDTGDPHILCDVRDFYFVCFVEKGTEADGLFEGHNRSLVRQGRSDKPYIRDLSLSPAFDGFFRVIAAFLDFRPYRTLICLKNGLFGALKDRDFLHDASQPRCELTVLALCDFIAHQVQK